MKGKKITSIEQVFKLADNNKSVWQDCIKMRIPAAVIQNWQARILYSIIQRGFLFEYIAAKDKKPFDSKVFISKP